MASNNGPCIDDRYLETIHDGGASMADYKVSKTIVKATTPPAVVIVGGKLVQAGLNQVGVSLDDSTCMMISSGVFGLFAGLVNFIKNRKRSR